MSTVLIGGIPWHKGEEAIHSALNVPFQENPTVPYLSPGAGFLLHKSPLLALGAIDSEGRPWSTVLGGEAGFAVPIGESIVGLGSLVDCKYDPVVECLMAGAKDGETVTARDGDGGKLVSALAIDLEQRRRVKLFGRMLAGSLSRLEAGSGGADDVGSTGECGKLQLAVKIEGSLGNCPKYLNKKHIVPAQPEPVLVSDSSTLPPAAVELLNRADCLFVSSCHDTVDMDTNIRGGPPGFVRVISNIPEKTELIYPEYSGNRLYQTLGNLSSNPYAGYVFPDFGTGDVLYATGRTEILIGKSAAAILPRSTVAVKVTITAARFVSKGLPFRGQPGEPSPYNPSVRYLATERCIPAALVNGQDDTNDDPYHSPTATMIGKESLTPTITRFRFRVNDPEEKLSVWKPGQYATFSFKDELDMGYSHMRDDDPTSLNDDWIRTFTISSSPPASQDHRDKKSGDGKGPSTTGVEFEITIRKVGNATNLLFRTSERAGLEFPLKGFGGSFSFFRNNDEAMDKHQHRTEGGDGGSSPVIIPFIAGGIGITPLLAQLPRLLQLRQPSNAHLRQPRPQLHPHPHLRLQLRLFWSISITDIGLVLDVFHQFPTLPLSTTLFISNSSSNTTTSSNSGTTTTTAEQSESSPSLLVPGLNHVLRSGATVHRRRMQAEDLDPSLDADVWYLCAGTGLKTMVLNRLVGKRVEYEDFYY